MRCFTRYISLSVSRPVPEGVNLSGWLCGETMTHNRLIEASREVSTSDPDPTQSTEDSQHLCLCL